MAITNWLCYLKGEYQYTSVLPRESHCVIVYGEEIGGKVLVTH